MRLPLALLAMLGLMLSTVLGPLATTRSGIQCPTATVQTVTSRDCCGHLVTRVPHAGDKDFKQCRCQEKRQGALRRDASPQNEALPPTCFALVLPSALPCDWTPPSYRGGEADWFVPPTIRPPNLA